MADERITREQADTIVAAVLQYPMPVLYLLYRVLHDGLGIRRHACDAEVRKLGAQA